MNVKGMREGRRGVTGFQEAKREGCHECKDNKASEAEKNLKEMMDGAKRRKWSGAIMRNRVRSETAQQ